VRVDLSLGLMLLASATSGLVNIPDFYVKETYLSAITFIALQ